MEVGTNVNSVGVTAATDRFKFAAPHVMVLSTEGGSLHDCARGIHIIVQLGGNTRSSSGHLSATEMFILTQATRFYGTGGCHSALDRQAFPE